MVEEDQSKFPNNFISTCLYFSSLKYLKNYYLQSQSLEEIFVNDHFEFRQLTKFEAFQTLATFMFLKIVFQSFPYLLILDYFHLNDY